MSYEVGEWVESYNPDPDGWTKARIVAHSGTMDLWLVDCEKHGLISTPEVWLRPLSPLVQLAKAAE